MVYSAIFGAIVKEKFFRLVSCAIRLCKIYFLNKPKNNLLKTVEIKSTYSILTHSTAA